MAEVLLIGEGEFEVFCINFAGRTIAIAECNVNGSNLPYNALNITKHNEEVMVELSQHPYRSEIFMVPTRCGFYEETPDGRLIVGVKNEGGEIMSSFSVKIV